MEGVRPFVCLRGVCGGSGVRGGDGVCGGNRGTGGGGVRGGMGSLVGPLLSTLTLIAETTLERRDHAGVLAAAAPETACSAETTLAFRDHGAGAVASERQRGFDAAGRPSASRQVTGESQSKG